MEATAQVAYHIYPGLCLTTLTGDMTRSKLITTLFGLLAVELAVQLTASQGNGLTHILAAVFFFISLTFVYRSFYGMRIGAEAK